MNNCQFYCGDPYNSSTELQMMTMALTHNIVGLSY